MKSDSERDSRIEEALFGNAAHAAIKETITSRTENMDTDDIFYNFEKTHKNSCTLRESTSSPELGDPWFKRLKHKPSHTTPLAKKRVETGNNSYTGDPRNFSKMLDCDSYSSKHMEELHESDSTPLLLKTGEHSSVESKSVKCWIRRWSPASRQAASPVPCEQVISKAASENYDREYLPSIRAMAFMRWATNSYRPSQFQRKGTLVVWNADIL